MPRPTRCARASAPRRLRRAVACRRSVAHRRSCLDLHQVAHPVDHAADRRGVGHLDLWLRWRKPRPRTVARCFCLVRVRPFTRVTLQLLAGLAGWFLRHLRPQAISSTFLPRLAAISRGRRCWPGRRASRARRCTGLVEPWHLARCWSRPSPRRPRASAPPALMPLPSDAGFIITRVAPWRPSTSWWIVPFFSGIFTMLRRACFHRLLHGHRHFARLALAHADASRRRRRPR